jgi:hypothetical protein
MAPFCPARARLAADPGADFGVTGPAPGPVTRSAARGAQPESRPRANNRAHASVRRLATTPRFHPNSTLTENRAREGAPHDRPEMNPRTSLLAATALALLPAAAIAQVAPPAGQQPPPGVIPRCGTPPLDPLRFQTAFMPPSDCSYNSTTIKAQYAPSVVTYTIPVVVHVIQRTSGTGYISPARIQTQIDILNEDFLAISGTNGSQGTDARIQFELATVDPNGNPTTGITYSQNNTWYNDGGSYWNQLAWDTNRYLNIYTNSASGALGYVPDLPQGGGIVGSSADRVVCLWDAFGRNAPIGPPYNQGRTVTHEVGHYLGLFHTFDGGCGGGNCYTSGDRICDTNAESSPTFGCPGSKTSCGSQDPKDNYMDYSDDLCMRRFTPEQINRMRCTLENWRPNLARVESSGGAFCFGDGTGGFCPCLQTGNLEQGCANSGGSGAVLTGSGVASISNDSFQLAVTGVPGAKPGIVLRGTTRVNGGLGNPVGDGLLCASGSTLRSQVQTTNGAGNTTFSSFKGQPFGATAVGAGAPTYYQFWYRDTANNCSGQGFNFTNAWEATWQP